MEDTWKISASPTEPLKKDRSDKKPGKGEINPTQARPGSNAAVDSLNFEIVDDFL